MICTTTKGTTMKVRVFGPGVPSSLRPKQGSGEEFHVHSADCRDCHRYGNIDGGHVMEFESRTEVADEMYADIMAENGDASGAYLYDFRFFPCVSELPLETEEKDDEFEGEGADAREAVYTIEIHRMGEQVYRGRGPGAIGASERIASQLLLLDLPELRLEGVAPEGEDTKRFIANAIAQDLILSARTGQSKTWAHNADTCGDEPDFGRARYDGDESDVCVLLRRERRKVAA